MIFSLETGYAYCLLSVIISESMTLNLSSGFVIVQQMKFMVNYKPYLPEIIMLIIKSRLFYKIGILIFFLFLKLRWREPQASWQKPKTKNINHNLNQNVYKEAGKTPFP